jgi:release factor glutamine methyltransferase
MAQRTFGLDPMALVRREREPIPAEWAAALEAAAQRRLAGEPVSRIIGEREFWGLAFTLNEATLDPRPETELLVADAIAFADKKKAPKIVDLGTGSGAIAISIASALPKVKAVATDISEKALEAARANAERHGVADRVSFHLGPWWQPVPTTELYDLIVSNPPYIASGEIETLQAEVRLFDPKPALDGGWDGLEGYRAIAAGASRRLAPGGLVLLEIGAGQGETVTRILSRAGFGNIEVQKDLAGLDRLVLASHS